MKLSEQQHGAVTVLRVDGPILDADAEVFLNRLSSAAAAHLGRVVIDASEVPYVDSIGLEAIVDASDRMSEAGQTLRLCGAGETLREVLDLTDVGEMVEQFEDVTDAVRSFM